MGHKGLKTASLSRLGTSISGKVTRAAGSRQVDYRLLMLKPHDHEAIAPQLQERTRRECLHLITRPPDSMPEALSSPLSPSSSSSHSGREARTAGYQRVRAAPGPLRDAICPPYSNPQSAVLVNVHVLHQPAVQSSCVANGVANQADTATGLQIHNSLDRGFVVFCP